MCSPRADDWSPSQSIQTLEDGQSEIEKSYLMWRFVQKHWIWFFLTLHDAREGPSGHSEVRNQQQISAEVSEGSDECCVLALNTDWSIGFTTKLIQCLLQHNWWRSEVSLLWLAVAQQTQQIVVALVHFWRENSSAGLVKWVAHLNIYRVISGKLGGETWASRQKHFRISILT